MAGSGIPFLANRGSRSLDIGTSLAASHILQDVDHVFDPNLDTENVAGLGVLARVASALLDGSLDSNRLGAALGRGQWEKALSITSSVVRDVVANPEHILAAAIAILHVPSCLIDLFTLGVTETIDLKDEAASSRLVAYSPASLASPEMLKAVASFASRNPTRSGLMRLTTFGSVNWLSHSGLYEFNFDSDPERSRFRRYSMFLNYISGNASTYTEVMKIVTAERWVEANALAVQRLSTIGVRGGGSLLDPPCLADFLILALTPWEDPLEIATKLKNSGNVN